jgi:hypothetical protein
VHGAREAVEQEALDGVVVAEPVLDHADRDLVGHQVAGVHVLARLETELGPLADVGPEDVPGGDLRDREVGRDELCLGALAGTGRSDEYEPH